MSSASKAFDMSKMAIGGIGQMLDSVEFVKRAWSTLNIPSTMVPTVDIDELDKRIADLKAVEQWLNVNLSMLRGTIQGLEIQRGTLAAVKAFGSTLGNIAVPATEAVTAATRVRAPSRAAQEPPAPAATPSAAPEPAAPAAAPAAATARQGADGQPGLPPPMLPGINPSAWWNLLQQNFNQVAQAALSGSGLQAATANLAKATAAANAAGKSRSAPSKRGAGTKRAPAKKARGAATRTRAPRSAG
jgi:hypothetical protein